MPWGLLPLPLNRFNLKCQIQHLSSCKAYVYNIIMLISYGHTEMQPSSGQLTTNRNDSSVPAQ